MADSINANISQFAPPAYQPRRGRPSMSGTVTHPDDLQPAIDAMPPQAAAHMGFKIKKSKPSPQDIAAAMDWYRETYGHNTAEELQCREQSRVKHNV